MKENFLVVNVSQQRLEELRRAVGEQGVVECESLESLNDQLHTSPERTALVRVDQAALKALSANGKTCHTPGFNSTVDSFNPHGQGRFSSRTNGSGNGHLTAQPVADVAHHPGDDGQRRNSTLAAQVDEVECRIIEETLQRHRHHRQETAADLGISRVTLYNKMKKFGLLG